MTGQNRCPIPLHSCVKKLIKDALSALGHKGTYAVQQPMSALLPIATAEADFRTGSCLLYPRKRTCAAQLWQEISWGGPDNPGVVVDDTLRCAHPMCLGHKVVAASILRCDPGHRSGLCWKKIAWDHKFVWLP